MTAIVAAMRTLRDILNTMLKNNQRLAKNGFDNSIFRYVRARLFMATLVALQHNAVIRKYYPRVRQQDKAR